MHSAEPTINESEPSLYAGVAASGVGEPWLRPRTALYIVATWTFVLLFNTEQSYASLAASERQLAWMQLFWLILPGMVLWALLTPFIMWLAIRYPLTWKTAPIHLLAAAVACVLDASLYHLVDPWVNPNGTRTWVAGFFRYMQINTISYFAVVVVTLVTRYATLLRERMVAAAELNSQLTTAHLRSLQGQLRPHFLFNTLNTIAELVHRDPEAADRMIGRLGALLRRSFDTHGDQEVSLESELEFLRDYSEIVCTRFQGRIAVTMSIDPEALGARVPSLVLQPLVENAVRHGLEPRAEGGTVEIVARRRLDVLELEVRDDGCGLPREDASGFRFHSSRHRVAAPPRNPGRCATRCRSPDDGNRSSLPSHDRRRRAGRSAARPSSRGAGARNRSGGRVRNGTRGGRRHVGAQARPPRAAIR